MAADIAARSSLPPHHMRHDLSAPRSLESPLRSRGSYANQSEPSFSAQPHHPHDFSRQQMQQLPSATAAASHAASHAASSGPITPAPPAAAIRWIRGPGLGGNPTGGKVSLALNSDTGEVLVVKSVAINSLPKAMRLLENEQAILEELRTCPRVVRLLGSAWESDPTSGAPVKNLFLEYVSAGSVLDIMGTFGCCGDSGSGGAGGSGGCGGLPEPLVRKYAHGVAEGLADLHARGIVHCDVKAANVLVAGAEGETKLCGLGAAMRAGEAGQRIARNQRLAGTYGWMAPEVVRQEDQGFASDVWSLACTVIEMATGLPPWAGQLPPAGNLDGEYVGEPSPDALLHAIGYSNATPAIPAHLSAEAVGFLRRCLERDPARRPSAAQLLEHPFLRASGLGSACPAPTAYPVAQQAARPPSGGRGSGARPKEESAGPRAGAGGNWAREGWGATGAEGGYSGGRERGEWGELGEEKEEKEGEGEGGQMEGYGWEDIGVSFGPSGAEGVLPSGPSHPSLGYAQTDPGLRPRVIPGSGVALSGGNSGGNSGGFSPGRLVSQGSLPPDGNQLPPLRKSPLQRSQSQPGQVILANTGNSNTSNSSNSNNSPSPPRPATQKPTPKAPPPYVPPPVPSIPANPPAPGPLFHPSGIRMGPLMRQISKEQVALRAAMAAAAAADNGGPRCSQERSGNSSNQGSASAAPVPPLPGRVGPGRSAHQRSSSVQGDFVGGDSSGSLGSANCPGMDRPSGRLVRGSSGILPGASPAQISEFQHNGCYVESGGVDSGRGGGGMGGGGGSSPGGLKSCLRRTSSCVQGASGGNDVGGSLGRGMGGRAGESDLQRMGSLTQAKKTVAFGAN
ncbi:hypothetical protein CLOM_g5797 [Closterium sp. NIES-68]|nr:hypothetical protein CLOM_g5797 [Closterium sp. NIES-68]GJP73853.1 hypothetical protein CLOP_g4529 [Closterium sp. NIES-67]